MCTSSFEIFRDFDLCAFALCTGRPWEFWLGKLLKSFLLPRMRRVNIFPNGSINVTQSLIFREVQGLYCCTDNAFFVPAGGTRIVLHDFEFVRLLEPHAHIILSRSMSAAAPLRKRLSCKIFPFFSAPESLISIVDFGKNSQTRYARLSNFSKNAMPRTFKKFKLTLEHARYSNFSEPFLII